MSYLSNRTIVLAMIVLAGSASGKTFAQDEQPDRSDIRFVDLLQPRGLRGDGGMRISVDQSLVPSLRNATGLLDLRLQVSQSESLQLRLERFEVTTTHTRFVRAGAGTSTAMTPPQVVLMRGEVAGEPGSHAFLAITERGSGSGSITLANGMRHHISSQQINGKAELLVRSGFGDDMPDVDELCRVIPTGIGGGTDGGSPMLDSRGVRVLTVAVDSDESFANLFDSEAEAQAYIVQLIGAVSDVYIRDLNMKLMLDFSRLWPDGGEPFSAADLGGFRSHWVNNEIMDGLNLVHLFSGRRDLSYGGIAYLADGCDTFGFGISGFLNGHFPQPVSHANWGNWDVIVVAHEMGHNMSTPHTHDYGPPIDQCTSGVEERGTIMSYCHTRAGGLRNIDVHMHTRVADFIFSNNPEGNCLWHDCNGNGQSDTLDISQAFSADSNDNDVPDECEDCNNNGILDPIDIGVGGMPDINANGRPDTCDPDCNANGVPDDHEIALGSSTDLNGNGFPDQCDPDCDRNGVADFTDIRNGTHSDLDRNRVPDVCQDCNGNGLSDWLDVDRQFNVYIGQLSGSVREYHASSGVFIREIGEGAVNGAYDIAFGPDRQLYVASFNDHRIVRLNLDGGISSTFVASGSGGLSHPAGLTFGPDGHLYVSSQGTNSVIRYNGVTGALMGTFVASGNGSLSLPWDLKFGPNGNLFVVSSNSRVLQYNGSSGAFINNFINNNLNDPRSLVFLANGHAVVANRGDSRLTRHDTNGAFLGRFNDEYPLSQPWSMTLARDGHVLAARNVGSDVRIVEFDDANGRYFRAYVRGDEGLTDPTSIALRPASPDDLNGNDVLDVCELPQCAGDIATPTDGNVGVPDLLALINAWGPCAPPCPADISPSGAPDGTVGTADLLALINSWGPCRP